MKNSLKTLYAVLFNWVKTSKVTALAIVVAATVVLLAVIVSLFAFSTEVPDSPPTEMLESMPVESQLPQVIIPTKEDSGTILKKIRLLLFENGFSANALEETSSVVNNKPIYVLSIKVEKSKFLPLYAAIKELLLSNGFTLLPTASDKQIFADDGEIIIDVLYNISEPAVDTPTNKPVEPEQPKALQPQQPPQPYKNIFGLTPPPKGNAEIALLIDDSGMNLSLAERLTAINIPFTIAVLPHTTFAKETAQLAKSRGKGVIMHLPMEPENLAGNDPGPGALLIEMPELLIEEIIVKDIESIGEIDGVNNHMGSALTSNETKIKQVLTILSKYTDTYIDSYTSPKSVAYRVCVEIGMKCGINRKFIDNEANQTYIASKIYEAMTLAQNNGAMIVIGHLRPDTVTVLEYVVPELTKLGYKFIPVETLIK